MISDGDPFNRWQHEQDVRTRHLGGRRRVGPDMTVVWLGGAVFVIAFVAWVVSSI